VAIRPEGFVPGEAGSLVCGLKRVEVMGRDISVVCDHPAFTGESFRAIIDSDELKFASGAAIAFDAKPHKVFLFEKETGSRVRF
jgi:multiple sugar transport system ATP-binding protein